MSYVSIELRKLVISRAGGCCEYCRLNQDDSAFTFHIEHIIAEKHGGQTQPDNLALSCPSCNVRKGTDLGLIDWEVSNRLEPLFHPRTQRWSEHFVLQGAFVHGQTPEGRVTVFLLALNTPDRIDERAILIRLNRYPCMLPETELTI